MNTTLDLFEAATVSLTRPTPIKDRLADAYRNYLVNVRTEDLPTDVSEEFRALLDQFNRVAPQLRGDDTLRATLRKMSNEDAAQIASAIVRIFGTLSRQSQSVQAGNGSKTAGSSTNVVPLHLAKG